MRFIVTLITSLILLLPASGQGQWEILNVLIRTTYRPPRGEVDGYALHDVQFIGRDNGFFLGGAYGYHFSAGLLFKTKDGGISWNRIFEDNGDYSSFHFVNKSKGFLIKGGNEIYTSTDSGYSWTAHPYIEPDAMFFLNDSTGWTSYKHSIFKTINGGEDWNVEYSIPDSDEFYSLYFIDDSTGWAVGESIIVKCTSNKGWENVLKPNGPLRKVSFVDRNNGWASGGYSIWDEWSNIFLRTVDGGENWDNISVENYKINDFYFVDRRDGWAVGEDFDGGGVILETFSSGLDWNLVKRTPERLNALHIKDGVGWAVGDDGLILRNESIATGIKEDNKISSGNEPLLQNYPNPFYLRTTISYQLLTSSDVELSIYDISGRKVATLVSEKQIPDKYEVEWNAEGMESGIYFCELKTGQGRQVMKMILLD